MDTVEAFGILKIADVLGPAIELAEGGFAVRSPYPHYNLTLNCFQGPGLGDT